MGAGTRRCGRRQARKDGAHAPGQALRLGVLFADGRRAATTSACAPGADDAREAGRLVLRQDGGGGTGRAWDQDFWIHPLPPDGPVTLVASWLDTAQLRAARNWTAG